MNRQDDQAQDRSLKEAKHQLALEIVRQLRSRGYQALFAGGCVRDLLLGQTPSDYDVATDARPEQVMGLFRRCIPVGASFGVVRVLGQTSQGDVEVATFRSDGAYVDGRHPEQVYFGTAERDAHRRDFTINGMFLDPISDEVIDYVGGQADLEAGIVRAIGDPAARFREDKLRLLRAVRFTARLDFQLDRPTRRALEHMAPELRVVAVERVAQELRKILVDRRRAAGLELIREVGLLGEIAPPCARLADEHDPETRDDLWSHTLRVLDSLPADPSFPLALAALLHETGCASELDRSRGLQLVAREIADGQCRRLRLSNQERERTSWLVEHHQALRNAPELKPSRLKRLLSHPGIEELLELHRAHALAVGAGSSDVAFCEKYMKNQPQGPLDPPRLITGHDLARLGLKPGPRFTSLLEAVRDAQLDGRVGDTTEALALVKESLEKSENSRLAQEKRESPESPAE